LAIGGKVVKTILTIVAGCVIAGILGLFVFFAISAKGDNTGSELPPCCATTPEN
jgi:hypothetical protein